MEKEIKYQVKYFISYAFKSFSGSMGWGNGVISRDSEISQIDDISTIEKAICDTNNMQACSILNFIKIAEGEMEVDPREEVIQDD